MEKPTETSVSRPPESSHSSAKTSSCPVSANAKRADEAPRCDPLFNKKLTTAIVDDFDVAENPIRPIVCEDFGQACMNYRSVSQNNAGYHTLTCAYTRVPDTRRPVSISWTVQHKRAAWDALIAVQQQGGCSPDEYPPAVMADVNDGYNILPSTAPGGIPRVFADRGQRIRYVASLDNKNAGNLFGGCPKLGPHRTEDNSIISEQKVGRRATTTWTKVRAVYTRQRFTMGFGVLAVPADDGIPDNPCAPTFMGAKHPGYALLNEDQWFNNNQAEAQLTALYASPPTRKKRDWIDDRGLVIIEGNSSRVATPEELRQEYGFESCSDDICSREIAAMKAILANIKEEISPISPVHINAEATAVSEVVSVQEETKLSVPGSNFVEPDFPVETGLVASMLKNKRTGRFMKL